MGYLYIFVGGALGALIRYMLSFLPLWHGLPIGTFLANMFGAFFMGFLSTYSLRFLETHTYLKKSITTGCLGALTTFSTFQFEVFTFISNNAWFTGFLYLTLSSLVGIVCCILGLKLGADVS
ncbi:fluoride efflux transporter CrcB [Staphylococcus agnetis]|uniref:fluoride efflux transporter CrcB n=1 Tax=Staphylococcus agnetis TaxID=985762 RepID=UPI0004E342F8|nr:fluoride efflux transporter CrcB [Staphylococcus agnetis]KFE42382.1 camphor resistance protein CrcB [Staphylococcus agnetis]NJH65072.1 fluoride efflux transporter CrcB [Staphylococcus agnetis]NJH97585.1 fluoride efflux transporter CrcB [Staphylococcus agnetis]PTH46473.1 fluoride efflux transporter CrcB [Staphylococcus agnetis]PTH71392.1 fluoride efflux transporter CrcB [Staphylococcus agnetis]